MKIKRATLHLVQWWVVRIAIIFTVVGVYYVYAHTSIFTITKYEIVGPHSKEMYSQIHSTLLEQSKKKTFFIIPNDKIFTYSNTRIITTIRATIPDVAAVTMRPVGLQTVKINITPLVPVFRISETEVITKEGIIFVSSESATHYPMLSFASSSKKTVKIDGLLFTTLLINEQDVDPLFIDNIVSVSTKVSSLIFPVASVIIDEMGDVSLVNAENTSSVKFLHDADPKKVWSTLVSAIDTEPLKSKLSKEKDSLIYLDVRYGNKLFYRFSDTRFPNSKDTAIIHPHETNISSTTQSSQ